MVDGRIDDDIFNIEFQGKWLTEDQGGYEFFGFLDELEFGDFVGWIFVVNDRLLAQCLEG